MLFKMKHMERRPSASLILRWISVRKQEVDETKMRRVNISAYALHHSVMWPSLSRAISLYRPHSPLVYEPPSRDWVVWTLVRGAR
jgi:hypothetical protein